MNGFVENEISINANGGTEIAKRKLTQIIKPELLEGTQIISSRPRELNEENIRIMFFHDLPNDPESAKFKDENYRNKFHHFVFISNWQFQQYQNFLGFEYSDKCSVIESGFEPIEVDWEAKKTDTIRFCYTSTPQRGLNILVPVFESLLKDFPAINMHLDVFSSFKIYGWDDADKQFEPLYDKIRNHPNMSYNGYVNNEELKSYLKEAHIHAYPCTWQETSCRAMLEAMSAGLQCVHPNYAGLPDSSGSLNLMYQGDSDPNKHAAIFRDALGFALERQKNNPVETETYLKYVKNYTDNRYDIKKIKAQWEHLLFKLHKQYPTIESRKIPSNMFIYRT